MPIKFFNWQDQVRMKSVLIVKIFTRVKTLERSSSALSR